MRWLLVGDVANFCPWDEGEVEELGVDRWLVPGDRTANWKLIAETSANAATTVFDEGLLDAWQEYGEQAGLGGSDLDRYLSLYYDPIDVSRKQWGNGRHRGWLIQQSGASRVAILDPAWVDPSWREDQEATGPRLR